MRFVSISVTPSPTTPIKNIPPRFDPTCLFDFEDCLSLARVCLFCLENVLIFSQYVTRVVDPSALNLIRA